MCGNHGSEFGIWGFEDGGSGYGEGFADYGM